MLLLAALLATRIVSTAPSITEMLFALGLGDRVQGVTNYCHYPPEALKKPKIGTYLKPDLETILSLRPDLVIVQKNPARLTERLTALKLKVLEVDHDTVDGIYDSIQRIADAAGVRDRAKSLNAKLRSDLAEIRRRTEKLPRRKMVFIVGRTPDTLDGLIAVGKGSYLNQLMEIAGGVNVFRDAVAPYPKVNHEEMLSRNPEVIVDMGDMADTVAVSEAHKRSVVALWDRLPSIEAVRRKRVFAVASDIFVVPGPRMVDAAREFARMLHPEAGF
jgi:iron complex transport system substrate-binding protein